ncbi:MULTISPECIES: chemotaxis protein CheB [unclassified Coleofasciculus]|uniref:chemotaxis protein CheB n=1 Tax=Cyanophyceae TaxID=3028117 RepID=UPI0030DBB15D
MIKPEIVVIGASAGGMEALKKLLAQLPSNFPGAIFIVWHIAPAYPSVLPQILDRVCSLPVAHAIDKEAIKPGRVYVAPPDHHLLVESGYVRVTKGPKENRFRPSIDVLFRSAARSYGNQAIGVVLTGMLDDGASGLYAVKEQGGKAIVQDPFDALHASMPIQAMKAVEVDWCVPVAEMGALLIEMTNEAVEKKGGHLVSEQMDIEVKVAREDNAFESGIMKLGKLSPYTCPECHGMLLQLKEGNIIRFRCHTGHAYSLNSLLVEVTESIEASLWKTLRGIEESEMLMSHMAKHLGETNDSEMAERFLQKSEQANRRASLVRQAVMSHETLSQEKIINLDGYE